MWLLITYKMSQFPSASTKSSQNNHSSSTNSFSNHFPLSPDCVSIAKDGCRPHQLPHSFLSPPVKSLNANFGSYSSDAIIASGNLPASTLPAGVAKMTVGSQFDDIPDGPVVPLLQPPLDNFRSVCSAIPSTSISLDGILDTDYGVESQRLRLRQCSGNDSSVSGFVRKPFLDGDYGEINHNHSDKSEDVSDSLSPPRSDSNRLVDRRTCTSNHNNIVDTSENSHTSSSDGSSDLSSMSPTSTETPNSISEQQPPPYSSAIRILSGMGGNDKCCANNDHHSTMHNHAQISSFSSISQNRSLSPSPGFLQTGYSVNSSALIDSMLISQLPSSSGVHDGIDFCSNSLEGNSATTTLAPSLAVISPKLSVNDKQIYSTATFSESKFGSCSHLGISSYERESRSRSPLAVDDAAEALLFLASQSTSQPSGIASFPSGSFGKLSNTTVTFGTTPFCPVSRIQEMQHVSVAGTHNPHFHSTLAPGHPSAGSPSDPTPIVAETFQIIASSAARQSSLATSLFLQSTTGITDENDYIEGTEFPPSNSSATFSLAADEVMNEDGFPASTSLGEDGVTSSVGVDSPSHVPLLSSSGGDFGALLSDVSDLQSFSWPDGDLPPVVPLAGIQPPPSSDSLKQVVCPVSSSSTQLPPSCLVAIDQPPSMVSYLDGGGNASLYPVSPMKPPPGVSSPVKVLPSVSTFVGVKPSPASPSEPAPKRFRSDLWRGFSTELSRDSSLPAQSDSAKGKHALSGDVSKENSMGLSHAKATVTISGRKLTIIQSVDVHSSPSSPSKRDLVSLAEVYRTFYCAEWSLAEFRRHVVDRFGLELSSGRVVNGLGSSERVDALSVNQIYSLLSKLKQTDRPSSIKGGLNCLKSTSNDNKFASELNKGNVRPFAKSKMLEKGTDRELEPNPSTSKSYVTRNTTQKDIFLIDYLGKTLPAIMVEGVEWTRLVDIEQVMFQPDSSRSNAVVGGQVDHMKKTCTRLGLHVEKCKANEKARLVVYANSVRHGSLHVVKAADLPSLLEAENKRRGVDRSYTPVVSNKTSNSKDVGKKDRSKTMIASQRLSISSADDSSGSGSETDFGNDNENNDTSSSNSGSEISDSDLPPVVTDLPTGKFNRISPDIVGKIDSKLAETHGERRSSIKASSSKRLRKKRRVANSLSSSSSDWSDSVTDSSDNEYDQGSRSRKSLYNSPSGSSAVMKGSEGHRSERLSPPPPPPKLRPLATKHGSHISKHSLNFSSNRELPGSKTSDTSSLEPTASKSGELRKRAKESDNSSKAPTRSPIVVKPDLFVKQNEDISLGLVLEVTGGRCRIADFSPNSVDTLPTSGRPTSVWSMPDVSVGVSAPLHLIVCNNRGQRGPVGKYFNNLFQSRMSDCILCCSCRQFWPVEDFLRHNHTVDGIAIEEARLLMYVDNPSTARFDLWRRFVVKLRRFRYKRQVYDLPADLSEFYERLSIAEKMKQFTESRVADPVAVDVSKPSTSNSGQGSASNNNSSDRLLEQPNSGDLAEFSADDFTKKQSVGTSDSTQIENTVIGNFSFKKPPPVLQLKLPKRKKPRGDAGQLVARRLENRRVNLDRYRAMADGVIGLGHSEREAVIDDWFR